MGEYLNSLNSNNAAKINAAKLSKEAWVLTVGAITDVLNKLDKQPLRLSDIFDKIYQGLATSKDDVYFLYECTEIDGLVTGFSKYLKHRITVEREFVKPLLKGEDVHRYDNIKSNRFVIFPYSLENDTALLYTEQQLIDRFPLGYSYLKECESELRGREKGRLNNDTNWYRYIYPKNLALFQKEKLVAPEISLGGNFAYDINGQYYSTTKVYGYIKNQKSKYSYLFLMGLLNSTTFWFFIKNTGYVLRGGYYTFKTNYIYPFPIPEYETIRSELILNIETNVKNILEKKHKKNNDILKEIENIDELIYKVYDFDKFDIQTIKEHTNIKNNNM